MPPMAYSHTENTPIPKTTSQNEFDHSKSPHKSPSGVKSCRQLYSAYSPSKNKLSEELAGWPLQSLPLPTKSEKQEDNLSVASEMANIEFGVLGTLGYRMLFLDSQYKELSPWHEIPLFTSCGNLNFVCTTPRGCWAEYEFAKDEPFNPIKLSSKNGKPLHYAENSKWNFGYLPQTWCSSSIDSGVDFGRLPFDDSPLYVLELSSRSSKTGDVYAVKPIAAYAVKEFGSKISWKILAVDANDPMASVSSVTELILKFPAIQDSIRNWLKTCRCIQPGDCENELAFEGNPVDTEKTHDIIAQMHATWKTYDYQISVAESFPTGPRPIKATKYECAWSKYTTHTTDVSIPLSDSNAGSSLQYDRAWANAEDKSMDKFPAGEAGRKANLPNGMKKQFKNMFNPTPNIKPRPRHKKNFSGELHTLIRGGNNKKNDHSGVSFLPAEGRGLPPTCIYRSTSGESAELTASANSARRWKSFDLTLASLEALNNMIESSSSPTSSSSIIASPVSSISSPCDQPRKSAASVDSNNHRRSQSLQIEDVFSFDFPAVGSYDASTRTLQEIEEESVTTSSQADTESDISASKPDTVSRASFIASMRVRINVTNDEPIQNEVESGESSSEEFAVSPLNQTYKFFPESPMTPTMYHGYLSKPDSPATNLPAGFGTKLRRWASLDAQALNILKEPNSPVMTPRTLRRYKLIKGRGFIQRSSSTECSPKWDDMWLNASMEIKNKQLGSEMNALTSPHEKFHDCTAMLTSRTVSC